ncbi:hypothetical protein LTS09_018015 [Friedmanniomyces endolithicus]|nr:hypothetical protein LTS09_018015 [Friedmanniomyces endolithicus]
MGARTSPSVESLPKTNHTIVLSIAQAARWSGLILQPDSSPVSEEQLRLEIKAIYAGLMIAEAKCVNLDAAQAKNPSVELDNSQWQESIALHTTYLSEHHDFLMATQHPSATPDLKELPTMYSMPARMWKYGIHDFLEVLRSRRPLSQEYMLSFIILAYQMMMLFYETAPVFSDTWIECLGNLARYRMSMEEEKEAHARLRKFACYGKSLTCVVPFPNARDSLRTLCIPIAGVAQPACSLELLSEASFCKLYALIFLAAPELELAQASNTAMSFLQQPGAFSWRNCGVSLAVANISALLGNGSDTNSLRVALDFTIQRINEQTMLLHSTTHHVVPQSKIRAGAPEAKSEENCRLLQVSKRMTLNAFYTAMRCPSGIATFQDSLAFVGVMFCFIHILCLAKRETQIDPELSMSLCLLFGPDEIKWALVAGYLNGLAQLRPVTDHLAQCAQQGLWLKKPEEGEPLPEDFSIRGLVWAYFAFCPGWFDSNEDEDLLRNVETSGTHEARADRPLYYGLRLAFETPYLSYDATSATFSAGSGMTTSSTAQALQPLRTDIADLQAQLVASNPNAQYSPPSAPASSASDSDYVHVKRPAKRVQTASSPKT